MKYADPADHWDWEAARLRCLREARRIVDSPRDAEDAVQEAFARAWRHRGACRTPQAPLGWLIQITRREAFRLRQRSHPAFDRPDDIGSLAAVPQLESLLARVDVDLALAELSPEDRALLTLRYGGDLTHPDIARLCGIPEGTVKVRLHRLRGRLRSRLTDEVG